jgi:hypothetical protein
MTIGTLIITFLCLLPFCFQAQELDGALSCTEEDIRGHGAQARLKAECVRLSFVSKRRPDGTYLRNLLKNVERTKQSKLVGLDFRRRGLKADDLLIVLDWISKSLSSRIEELQLGGIVINDEGWEALLGVVRKAPSLHTLGLEGCNVNVDRIADLVEAIGSGAPKLGELLLEGNMFSGPGLDAVVALVERRKTQSKKAPHRYTPLNVAHPAVRARIHHGDKTTEQDASAALSRAKPMSKTRTPPGGLHMDILPLLESCDLQNVYVSGLAEQFDDLGVDDAMELARLTPDLLESIEGLTPVNRLTLTRCICLNYLHQGEHAQRLRSGRNAHDLAKRFVGELCTPHFLDLHDAFAREKRHARGRAKETKKYHADVQARSDEATRMRTHEREAQEEPEL